MQDLHFAKPCTFTDDKGETRVFAPGRHKNVPAEIAGHWFVQAHLVKDTDEPSVPETAPLQHEERLKVKAAIDAAEGRAAGFAAERDAAVERVGVLEAENVSLKARVAELEEASQASREAGSERNAPTSDDDEFAGKVHSIKRRHQGKYAVVMQADGKVVVDSLSKADAEAKARELNAQG